MTALALVMPVVAAALVSYRLMEPRGWTGLVRSAAIGAGGGIGLSSIPFFLWRLLELPLRLYPVADAGLWLSVAALAIGWRRWPVRFTSPAKLTPAWIVASAATMVVAGLSILAVALRLAHVPHGEWDAWAYWQVRASFLGSPEGWQGAFSPGAGSDYPLMLPAAVARVWTIAGYSAAAPAAISVIFAASTAALLGASLWTTSPLIGAAGVGLLLVPEFLFHATGQCADVPLAFFLLVGVVGLSGPGTPFRMAVLSGVAIGLAAWTKNEGLVIATILPTAFTIAAWRSAGKATARPQVAGLLAGMAPACLTVLLYHLVVDPPAGLAAGVADTSPMAKLMDWSRHRTVLQFLVTHTAQWGLWVSFSPVWIVAAWTAAGGIRRRTSPAITAGRTTAVALLAATYLVYVLTPYDLEWHMLTSWTRIVAQVWPVAVWTALAWIGRPPAARTSVL